MSRKLKPLVIEIGHDEDAESPCDNDGWKAYSFSTSHNNFKEPEELGFDPHQPIVRSRSLKKKLKDGLAFILSYFEHGQSAWMLQGSSRQRSCPDWQWDGVTTAGLLVWEWKASDLGPKTYAERWKSAESFLECFTAWCNGECYYAVASRKDAGFSSANGYDELLWVLVDIIAEEGEPGQDIEYEEGVPCYLDLDRLAEDVREKQAERQKQLEKTHG